MKKALICRSRICRSKPRRLQAGVTMILVAICMTAIIGMAVLSIDVITRYLARMEAQRTADAAALAAARVISVSGITGDAITDTTSWQAICGTSGIATQAAQAVASQTVANASPTVTVKYSSQGSSGGVFDCSGLSSAFAINPTVIVQVTRSGLPTLFWQIWSVNTVSATAMAEAFNPSNSGSIASGGQVIPVAPRCVKPWAVPNQDPLHTRGGAVGICTGGSTGNCAKIVNLADGSIANPGISLSGSGTGGIIGETFWLNPDCRWGQSSCTLRINTPQANYNNGSGFMKGPGPPLNAPNLVFAPGQVGTTAAAVPSCAVKDDIEEAVAGCDSPQNYSCGLAPSSGGTNAVDLSSSPDSDIADAVSCLIHQTDTTTFGASSGQDYLSPFGAPTSYPFQVLAGSGNPLAARLSGDAISSSTSIVSLPIYDETSATLQPGTTTQVTFVGFLQVFINAVDQYGNVNVTVLNVAGCGNNASTSLSASGSSPVPVRLITQP